MTKRHGSGLAIRKEEIGGDLVLGTHHVLKSAFRRRQLRALDAVLGKYEHLIAEGASAINAPECESRDTLERYVMETFPRQNIHFMEDDYNQVLGQMSHGMGMNFIGMYHMVQLLALTKGAMPRADFGTVYMVARKEFELFAQCNQGYERYDLEITASMSIEAVLGLAERSEQNPSGIDLFAEAAGAIGDWKSAVREREVLGPMVKKYRRSLEGPKAIMAGMAHLPFIVATIKNEPVVPVPSWQDYVDQLPGQLSSAFHWIEETLR